MPNSSLSQAKARQQQTKTLILTTLGVLGALLACFCFGFFVLSRRMPTNTAENTAPKTDTATQPSNTAGTSNSPTEENSGLPTVPNETKKPLKEGPTIEADPSLNARTPAETDNGSGVTPDKQDNRDDTNSTGDTEKKSSERKSRKKRDPEGEPVQEPSSIEKKPREKRRHDTDTERKNTEETTPPEERRDEHNRDDSNKDEPATKEPRKPETVAKADDVTPRRHRVQVGVYSTKESAEVALIELQARGIETKVRRVSRNGKTYYSLQSGSYKSKESAEAKRQKLQDAGQDAYITQD